MVKGVKAFLYLFM